MCVGVIGEVCACVHMWWCGKGGTLYIWRSACSCVCGWVHMCASLNLKTENFQITCNLFKAIAIISRNSYYSMRIVVWVLFWLSWAWHCILSIAGGESGNHGDDK